MKTAKSWASTRDIHSDNYYNNKNKSSTLSSYSNNTSNGIASVDTKLSAISRKVESILAESKDNDNENHNEFLRNSLRDSIGSGTSEILFKAMKEIKYKKADAKNDGSLSARYESKDDANKTKLNKQFSSDDIDALLMDAAKEVIQKSVAKSLKRSKSRKSEKNACTNPQCQPLNIPHHKTDECFVNKDGTADKLKYKDFKLKQEKIRLAHLCSSTYEVSKADMKRDPTLRYSLYEDAKECTFKPKIHGKKKSNSADDKESEKSRFIERQEAEERHRREDLEDRIGKAAYEASLDKKYCPSCGAKQSYDEVKDKRKECPNCKVEYKRKIVWEQIQNNFFKKGKEYAIIEAENKKKLIKDIEREELEKIEKTIYDSKTGKVVTVHGADIKALNWEEVKDDFYERLEEFQKEKEKSLLEIKKKVTPTFKPMLKREAKTDDDEQPTEVNPRAVIQAFLQRLEEDEAERRQSMPYKFNQKKELSIKAFKP